MWLEHNPLSFLTGDDPFIPTCTLEADRTRVDQEFAFEDRHEGFIGIPHGGLPMGLCLDAWRRTASPSYPVDVKFKFGGTGVMIGDSVLFSVERRADGHHPGIFAAITKNGEKAPYLKAEIIPAPDAPSLGVGGPVTPIFRDLPYYRNCFVCGHHRSITGLQRRFRVHLEDGLHVSTCLWGTSSDDHERAKSFLIGREEIHPAVLVSIFDENTAWAGFMQTKSAGLSVRLAFTLMRPIARSETLLFVGRPGGIRGNPRAPRFFLAEGTILSVDDRGTSEPVAFGRGEWIIMDRYTEQIKTNLLPENDWEWIFSD